MTCCRESLHGLGLGHGQKLADGMSVGGVCPAQPGAHNVTNSSPSADAGCMLKTESECWVEQVPLWLGPVFPELLGRSRVNIQALWAPCENLHQAAQTVPRAVLAPKKPQQIWVGEQQGWHHLRLVQTRAVT